MTDKTEAQPEALELADRLIGNAEIDECEGCNPVVVGLERSAATELRRQHAEIQQLKAQLSARQAAPEGPWKCGNEYLPYHPDASHVDPAYRDGWNDCYRAAPPSHEREPLTDEQIEAAYKNLQVRRKQDQDEAFQAGIGKSCIHCNKGHYQADWNGYSTFHRCDKCRHVPFDLSGLVKKSAASCWCETCRPNTLSDMRFIVCPDCGNKRCPKATHHDNACTNSNAPGQPGSSWEHVKPHGATND